MLQSIKRNTRNWANESFESLLPFFTFCMIFRIIQTWSGLYVHICETNCPFLVYQCKKNPFSFVTHKPEDWWWCFHSDLELSILSNVLFQDSSSKFFIEHLLFKTRRMNGWMDEWVNEWTTITSIWVKNYLRHFWSDSALPSDNKMQKILSNSDRL